MSDVECSPVYLALNQLTADCALASLREVRSALETETLKLETPHIAQRGLFPAVNRQSLAGTIQLNHGWTRIPQSGTD
jgi:hypothetical protein